MKRFSILFLAGITALLFTALQEVYASGMIQTAATATSTPAANGSANSGAIIGSTGTVVPMTAVPVTAIVITSIGPVTPIPSGDGSVPSDVEPPYPQPYPYPYPYTIILTPQDSGRSFVVPLNSIILAALPRTPFSWLSYDPSVLQMVAWPPHPIPVDPPIMPDDSAITPMPQPDLPNVSTDSSLYPRPGWYFQAVGYGTTQLTLMQKPCYDRVCPKIAILNFSVTITVQDGIEPPYPPPSPMPPMPPVVGPADVYIGTAYLDQTVQVHVGQSVAVDLPFLSPSEPVVLNFDNQILQPLPETMNQYPQPGGWRFRVVQGGTTTFTVSTRRCTDGSTLCTPSLLFRVTLVAS